MDVRRFNFFRRQPFTPAQDHCCGVPKRAMAFLLANFMFWQPLWAQAEGLVVATPGTTLEQAGNGVPIVNIATPNGSGVSHNQFQDYNVGAQGLILNNGSTQTLPSQLGGLIVGNPHLINSGSAQTILNEVIGASPSQLRGYTEVAGQSARVIVANPYGITCNGCGFINTPRVTLTTGKPVFDGMGRIERYRVDQGHVAIDGAGLNAGNIDRFEIITRSARINAEIQARDLTVVAGRNDVNAQTLHASVRTDDGLAKPQLAIDSSALGGMYAGAIRLVATEAGVGVRMAGDLIASAGDIQIDANGHLSLAQAKAAGVVDVKAASLEAQRLVYGTAVDLHTRGNLNNQGTLAARDRLTLQAGGELRNGGLIEAGVEVGERRNTTGDVRLSAQRFNNAGGRVIASRDLTVDVWQELDNRGGTLSGQRQVQIDTTTLDNRDKGRVLSADRLKLTADQVLNRDGLIKAQTRLDATLGHLDNSAGEVSTPGNAALKLRSLENGGGTLLAQMALDLNASGAITNQGGWISGWQGLDIKAKRIDNAAGGSLGSGAFMTLQADTLNNNGGTIDVSGDLRFTGTELDNTQGVITGRKTVTLDLLGRLINTRGHLLSAGPLRVLHSTGVDNRGGELSSQSILHLFTGDLDNSGEGVLKAAGKLLITASGVVDNRDEGLIASSGGDLHLGAARLVNAKGTVQAQESLTLEVSVEIDNQGGRILALDGPLSLKAASLNNRGGGIAARNNAARIETVGLLNNSGGGSLSAKTLLEVDAGALDNNAGKISAQRIDLALQGALNNRNGLIDSQTTLAITAASLDNQTGRLRAMGGDDKSRFYIGGLLDNREGFLEVTNTDLTFEAGGFLNQGGHLVHTGKGVLGLSKAHLQDVGGRLETLGQLTVEGDDWTNSTLIQAERLTLNVNHLTQTGVGQLLATQQLEGKGTDWSNDGLIASEGSINLDLTGRYSGSGRLTSLGALNLHAASLDLDSRASIAGGADTRIDIDGLMTNAGRITSSQHLTLTAAGIHNHGTLASGKDLRLNTENLLNDNGLISSGGDMQLRVSTFTNRYAQVFSLGSLLIARDAEQTQADLLDNRSGVIESIGQMTVEAITVNNVRDLLEYTEPEKSATRIIRLPCELLAAGCDQRRRGRINGLWEIAETDSLRVTRSSAASSLSSGADLLINARTLNNTSSTLASAGNLQVNATNINNKGLLPQEIKTLRRYWSYVKETRNAAAQADLFNARNNPDPSATFASDLSAFLGWMGVLLSHDSTVTHSDPSFAAIIQAGGSVQLNAEQTFNNSVVRSSYAYVGAGQTQADTGVGSGYSTLVAINPQLPPEIAQQQVNPVALPGFALPTRPNGLFRLSSASPPPGPLAITGLADNTPPPRAHKYLIETNPALTDLKQFMSSDYLLGKLGFDPDASAKRLGDGFYEQRLIQQAVVARTGQRFIAGLTSDEALFKYLMDNAIASKNRLNLALGVTLTAEQVAALTHDIVWLENHPVNGEQVLVPVLYLAQSNNRLAPNGALVAGKDLNLITGQNLNNVGTLRASDNLSATAGDNLLNSGLIESGKRLELLAGHNLLNRGGGIIAAGDVSVTAVTGDVLNERSVTTHQSSGGAYTRQERRDFADNAARIEARNDLAVTAGRDLNVLGGILQSGLNLRLEAGRDVNVTSVQVHNSVVQGGGKYSSNAVTQLSASLDAGRDVAAKAERDINVIASTIDAGRDVAMAAGENLTISSAADEEHSSFRSRKARIEEDRVRQVSSYVNAGGSVDLDAGKDLDLIASRVSAQDEAYLFAANNLTLQSAENSDYSFYSKTSKTDSGKKSRLDELASTTHIASAVTSGSDSALVAGTDLLIKGSEVTAQNSGVRLVAGNDAQILAVTDSRSVRHESSSSKNSWGGLKSKKLTYQLSETQTTSAGSLISGHTLDVSASRDVSIVGSSLVSTQDLTVHAGRDLAILAAENTFTRELLRREKNRDLTGVLTGNKLGIDDMTGNQRLSVGSRNHASELAQKTLTASTVGSSEGNVSLTSGRELGITASDLVSTGNMSLVGSNVTIASGMESTRQNSTDQSRNLGVGRVLGSAILDTVNSIRSSVKAANDADDPRLRAVKLAQAAMAFNDLGNQVGDSEGAGSRAGKNQGTANGSLIKIGTELANTRRTSTHKSSSETARQSTLNAGENLLVIAKGSAPGTAGDIHVIGSRLKAGDTELRATNNILLESASNTANWSNKRSNDKTAFGASFNLGQQNGFTFDLGGSVAGALGTGKLVTQVNSSLSTGSLVLHSGQDTTLAGAQVRADKIKALIAGDLNIVSRQDIQTRKNKQSSAGAGASICVPPICSGPMVAASASLAASNMNSDYKAVTDQSGLFAGEGGYDINVGKNTLLNGAVIASEASADKNLLSTDRLIVSDIKNTREIKAQSASVTVTSGSGVGLTGGGSIPLSLTESKHSHTRSAVSEGALTVRSAEGANDLVGLNRDTANANQVLKPPDEKAIQARMALVQGSVALAKNVIGKMANAEQQAADARARSATTREERQAAIDDRNSWDVGGDKRILADVAAGLIAVSLGSVGGATAVGVVAHTTANDMFKVIGDYADRQHSTATDKVTRAAWDEGGAARVMLHGLAGAAMGLSSGNPASGGLGAGASASVMPLVADALSKSGLTSAEQKDLNGFIAGGLGALVGAGEGPAGAITAGSGAVGVEVFNRQLHRQQEIPLLKQKAAELAKRIGQPRSSARWEDLLLVAAGAEVDAAILERLTALWMQSGNDPESGAFAEDMNVAYGVVTQLAAQKIPLTWSDGQPIVANGAPVYAFGATKEQAEDSTLFNIRLHYGATTAEEHLRQYGQEQTGKYAEELRRISTSDFRLADAAERLSVFAGKGIHSVSAFDDALLSVTGLSPAKAVVESILIAVAKRQSVKALGAKGLPSASGLLHVPGRVQSRIDLQKGSQAKGVGWIHLTNEHYSAAKNKSQFIIPQEELRQLLQSQVVVNTPVTKILSSSKGLRYVRQVDVGRDIGTDKFNDFLPTTKLVILTDKFGSLVSAFPGVIE